MQDAVDEQTQASAVSKAESCEPHVLTRMLGNRRMVAHSGSEHQSKTRCLLSARALSKCPLAPLRASLTVYQGDAAHPRFIMRRAHTEAARFSCDGRYYGERRRGLRYE